MTLLFFYYKQNISRCLNIVYKQLKCTFKVIIKKNPQIKKIPSKLLTSKYWIVLCKTELFFLDLIEHYLMGNKFCWDMQTKFVVIFLGSVLTLTELSLFIRGLKLFGSRRKVISRDSKNLFIPWSSVIGLKWLIIICSVIKVKGCQSSNKQKS